MLRHDVRRTRVKPSQSLIKSLFTPLNEAILKTTVANYNITVAQAAHGSSLRCAPTPAAALCTVPGGLPSKRLMSQLSSCASKSSVS